MARKVMLAAVLALGLTLGSAQAQNERATPYWASISAGKAMMRTGPGTNYPATGSMFAPTCRSGGRDLPNWRRSAIRRARPLVLQRLSAIGGRPGQGDAPRPLHQDLRTIPGFATSPSRESSGVFPDAPTAGACSKSATAGAISVQTISGASTPAARWSRHR